MSFERRLISFPKPSGRTIEGADYNYFGEVNTSGGEFSELLRNTLVPERNLRGKGHLGGEIQNTHFP